MKKIELQPELIWNWSEPKGKPADAECIPISLLARISETGSIAQAAEDYGFSYRHVWGLIRYWEKCFHQPLVIKKRGHGTSLTPLGSYLVRMDSRMKKKMAGELTTASKGARQALSRFIALSCSKPNLSATHGVAEDIGNEHDQDKLAAISLIETHWDLNSVAISNVINPSTE